MALHTGKKFLITGSSRGIGAGIAQLLAAEGALVAVTYSQNEKAAHKVLNSLEGSGHIAIKLDISSESSIAEAFKEVFEKFGHLDGLVNNAGITKDNLFLRMKTEDFDKVIETNLKGTFLCTKAVIKPMMKNRNGSVVNITSLSGQAGNPGQCNYSASKAGVEAFSKSIAQEFASRNIRINCVAPGFIATDMTQAMEEKAFKSVAERVPMNRWGDVKDIAHAVSFLLSENASYITGQTISVNGGLYM
ncbi:MAG: 3-oxoacyl-[acyl-carrier-protein] reductase [Bdellovibrionales bacterium]|nr:3-oxoacyl-[acyl-carrier-protein] reductase [Bdellovibrionales bacterium]